MNGSDSVWQRQTLMEMMLDRLGLRDAASHEEAVGMMVHRMVETCRYCRDSARCEEWLARGDVGDPEGYRRFCPNAERLLHLRRG